METDERLATEVASQHRREDCRHVGGQSYWWQPLSARKMALLWI